LTATFEEQPQPPTMFAPPSKPEIVMIDKALDKGYDPDKLGKLIELAEHLADRRALEAFNIALNDAQAEMPAVIKNLENDHTKKMYAELAAVVSVAKPVYTKHGFSVSFSQDKPWTEGNVHFVMTVRHRDGHVDTRHGEYARDGVGAKGGSSMNPLQGTVSSGSYCQRDMLRLYFNIPIQGADKDGNGQSSITPEQIQVLNEAFDELERLGRPVNLKKFYAWCQVETLDQLSQKQFVEAVSYLARKRREPAKGGAA
jgi:hypothetical protein